jgi:hypothetical protein
VRDRALDRGVDLLLGGQRGPLIDAHVERSGGEILDRLGDDLQALPHFLHPHEVAGVAVAGRRAADLKLEVLVGEIRLVLAEVAGDAAGPRHRAGGPAVGRLLLREHADALRAVDEDAVAGQQPLHVVEGLGEGRHEAADLLDHQGREVLRRAADTGVAVGESGSAERLEDVVDHLALIERVEEEGEGTGVEPDRPVAQEVVTDARELGDDRTDVAAPRRELDAEEGLDGVVPGDVVRHRRDVVHPVGHGDVLVERQMFADLLEPGVQVAHLRQRVDDPLTLELEHEAERRVGGRVLGAEVERPEVVLRPLSGGLRERSRVG